MRCSNLNFVHFTGFVNDPPNSTLRSALFVVHPPEDASTAPAATTNGAATDSAAAPTQTQTHHRRNRKGFTFKPIPIRDVIGLEDESKIDSIAVRPLFYAAASGKRPTIECLISAYKKGNALCSSYSSCSGD